MFFRSGCRMGWSRFGITDGIDFPQKIRKVALKSFRQYLLNAANLNPVWAGCWYCYDTTPNPCAAWTLSSETAAQGYSETVARKPGPSRRKIKRQRIPAAVSPDDTARALARANLAKISVAPGQVESDPLAQRHSSSGCHHPGQARPASARYGGRRRREGHGCRVGPGSYGADAGPDEWSELARPSEVHKTGQHPGYGR